MSRPGLSARFGLPFAGAARQVYMRPILQTAAYEGSAKLSPDGRWLAYGSNDSGRMEVYLCPFPGPDQ